MYRKQFYQIRANLAKRVKNTGSNFPKNIPPIGTSCSKMSSSLCHQLTEYSSVKFYCLNTKFKVE